MPEKRRFTSLAGLLVVWLAAGMAPLTWAAVDFSPAVNYEVIGNTNSLAVADFNGDGNLDLVTANVGNNVSVLLGNGNGTFGTATSFSIGAAPVVSYPEEVAVGDFNGDGKPDLVTANPGSNNVSVLLGNGGGAFGAAMNFSVGRYPFSVAVGDFNGDGKLDLVTANANGNNVSVLLGNGNGTFGAAANFSVGVNPAWVAMGDFSGDGKLDLVTANHLGNNVSVLLGNGNGTFGPATNFSVGTSPYWVGGATSMGMASSTWRR